MTSVYQQEMAKRGLVLPKATGCPRGTVRLLPVTLSEAIPKDRTNLTRARWAEWRKLYEVDGLGLNQIAEQYRCSAEGVRSALKKMGVHLRKRGFGTMKEVLALNTHLLRENHLLRAKLSGLRRKQENQCPA